MYASKSIDKVDTVGSANGDNSPSVIALTQSYKTVTGQHPNIPSSDHVPTENSPEPPSVDHLLPGDLPIRHCDLPDAKAAMRAW